MPILQESPFAKIAVRSFLSPQLATMKKSFVRVAVSYAVVMTAKHTAKPKTAS